MGDERRRTGKGPRRAVGSRIIGVVALVPVLSAFAWPETRPQTPLPNAGAVRRFTSQVAPLLVRRCLPCHDTARKQGGLDLSSKASTARGGRSGRTVVAGKPGASLLWKRVDSGQMPPDKPLSAAEKRLVRQWIVDGAAWGTSSIAAPEPPPRAAGPTYGLRRLTVDEYVATVRAAVGVDIGSEARQLLPPDLRADGFRNTAYNLRVDLKHVEGYARLAQIAVGRLDTLAFLARFSPGGKPTPANLRATVTAMGAWLLRGPLDSRETASFLKIASAAQGRGSDFAEAGAAIVEAMLQSPRFLYRVERQIGDGKPHPVVGYELASRLSYLIWGGPPDTALFRAAGSGKLVDPKQIAGQVTRMLQDPRAVRRSERFLTEWLDLDRLTDLRPDPKRFPTWNARLAQDMRSETLATFEEVVWKRRQPLAAILDAQVTFATPRLAEHYGLSPRIAEPADRRGLVALYRFDEAGGDTVHDRSGGGEGLDLKIADPGAVAWGPGRLTVRSATLIATATPPARLIAAVRKSQALSLEAWITPGDARQKGPARIVTISSGPSLRNATLGQDGDRFEVRFRTRRTDANGIPSAATPGGFAAPRLTHVAYVRDPSGKARIYVDGVEAGAVSPGGDLGNWDGTCRLALANETTRDRPWKGTFHQVAIYSRALSPDEVRGRSAALARYDLSSVPERGGLLTQGAVLTLGGDDASMVSRGLFVLHDLFSSAVGSPPPGVDTTPVPTRKGLSQRAAAAVRIADRACTGCHSRIEPLAFGLERFDGVGAFRETDAHGNRLREDGSILFPGQSEAVPYRTVAEMMRILARSDRVRMSLTRKLTQFALGRPLVPADDPVVARIHTAAGKAEATYPRLIAAIATSDLVRKKRTEKQP